MNCLHTSINIEIDVDTILGIFFNFKKIPNRLMVARGEGIWGLSKKGEGIEKYTLAVME